MGILPVIPVAWASRPRFFLHFEQFLEEQAGWAHLSARDQGAGESPQGRRRILGVLAQIVNAFSVFPLEPATQGLLNRRRFRFRAGASEIEAVEEAIFRRNFDTASRKAHLCWM